MSFLQAEAEGSQGQREDKDHLPQVQYGICEKKLIFLTYPAGCVIILGLPVYRSHNIMIDAAGFQTCDKI